MYLYKKKNKAFSEGAIDGNRPSVRILTWLDGTTVRILIVFGRSLVLGFTIGIESAEPGLNNCLPFSGYSYFRYWTGKIFSYRPFSRHFKCDTGRNIIVTATPGAFSNVSTARTTSGLLGSPVSAIW